MYKREKAAIWIKPLIKAQSRRFYPLEKTDKTVLQSSILSILLTLAIIIAFLLFFLASASEVSSQEKNIKLVNIEIPSNLVTLQSGISNRHSLTKGDTINGNAYDGKIDQKLLSKLSSNEKIGVTVRLNYSSSEKYSEQKNKLINDMKKTFNLTYAAHSIPSVSISATKNDIEKLEKLNYVESISLRPNVSLFLQDSAPLINATRTWTLQSSGINLTGIGQTVCVIDSGINYSHSDFGGCTTSQFLGGNCTKIIGGYAFYNPVNTSNLNDVMGDNNHGTHIAGIIAANGSINGAAPGARIVAIKACGPTSSCDSNAIVDSVNWCVGNSMNYNITVISMSLGTDALFNGYCDADWPELTSAINSAAAKNISVVVAAGNSGNTTAISNPACITNVTSVGATDKSDAIWSLSNRNSITDLLAPGVNINSTDLSRYTSLQGTSMSAPHVSGAIVLIRQFLSLTSQSKAPQQIENTLNATGKIISDSAGSGLNFSRINVYNAIISYDIIKPNTTLLSPTNNKVSLNSNQTFACNATDLALKNVTFFLWNSTSGIINQTFKAISGQSYSYQLNITNISLGRYKWNCLFIDENNNFAFSSSNFSLTIGGVSMNLLSPINNNYTNINSTNFSCQSLSEQNSALKNVTFYLWNSTMQIYLESKNISGFDNTTIFNYTFTYEENYKWNCFAYNNNSNSSLADQNYSIVFDTTKPNVSLLSPAEAYSAAGTTTLSFQFNVTDSSNVSSCELILNNAIFATNSSIILNISNYISYSLTPGGYVWNINCTDQAGNIGNSSLQTLTINAPVVSSTSGGGSGGGGTQTLETIKINENELSAGTTREIKKSDKITFTIPKSRSENHSITITDIANSSVNLTIQSNPIKIYLSIGQEKTINLTSNYSLYLKLNNILNKKANLTIRLVEEKIIPKEDINKTERNVSLFGANETTNNMPRTPDKDNRFFIYTLILLASLLIISILISAYLLIKFMKKPKRKKRK